MLPKKRAELKKLIANASAGPWAWQHRSPYSQWITCANGGDIALTLSEDDAKYVAAVSPDVTGELIQDLDDKEEALLGVFYMIEDMRKAMGLPKDATLQEIMKAVSNIVMNALKEAGIVK